MYKKSNKIFLRNPINMHQILNEHCLFYLHKWILCSSKMFILKVSEKNPINFFSLQSVPVFLMTLYPTLRTRTKCGVTFRHHVTEWHAASMSRRSTATPSWSWTWTRVTTRWREPSTISETPTLSLTTAGVSDMLEIYSQLQIGCSTDEFYRTSLLMCRKYFKYGVKKNIIY